MVPFDLLRCHARIDVIAAFVAVRQRLTVAFAALHGLYVASVTRYVALRFAVAIIIPLL